MVDVAGGQVQQSSAKHSSIQPCPAPPAHAALHPHPLTCAAEEEANAYFQRVYAGEISVESLVEVGGVVLQHSCVLRVDWEEVVGMPLHVLPSALIRLQRAAIGHIISTHPSHCLTGRLRRRCSRASRTARWGGSRRCLPAWCTTCLTSTASSQSTPTRSWPPRVRWLGMVGMEEGEEGRKENSTALGLLWEH